MNCTTYSRVWRDEHIFSAPDAPAVQASLAQCQRELTILEQQAARLSESLSETELGALLVSLRALGDTLHQRLHAFVTYAYNRLSRNGQERAARELLSRATELSAELAMVEKPIALFWARAEAGLVERLLKVPELAPLSYPVMHQRRHSDQLLSLQSEQLVEGLGVDGLLAWGDLYDALVARLKVPMGEQRLGLAQAANLLASPDRSCRQQAWQGIYAAWEGEQETVAAILNAINGWRHTMLRQRGHQRRLDALDLSCHHSHIERATLDTLMKEAYAQRHIGQRALRAMAKGLGVSDYAPWDLYAPAPCETPVSFSFEQAIDLVAEVFARFDPEMGDFVRMMAQKGWIDADPTPHRRTGAYCTEYQTPAEPRVFLTFEGSMDNVITLAHELGHAWHSWLLRDLPRELRDYPMTLAETASIFAETLVREALMERAETREAERAIAWMEADSAATMLVDIPSRFDFEQRLVAAREQGFSGGETLREMMGAAMSRWYEDTLSCHNDLFWASKGHFSIAEFGFYNYPYLFGYLFSLGVYAQRTQFGGDFAARYRALLCDTGCMSAETLVRKHLGADIREPAFWRASLAIVEAQVARFEALV